MFVMVSCGVLDGMWIRILYILSWGGMCLNWLNES